MIVTDNNFSKHTKYDVKNAVNDIVEFQKHLIRYVQQKKSKNFSLEQLHDELSAFWLKDFNQKILSMKFSEGQKEYFGKKGISLHVDRLIFRSEGSLKVVYFTIIYRCDQDVKDVLLINEDVIKEFVKSHPQIKKICMKFDNAGCYHNSQSPEALFNISQKYGLTLQRYDFNEPAWGKDQCDRESATAKSYICNYVDNGHDLLNADDKKGKERLDRKLNNLFYCHELGWCEVFHGKKSYENHLIKDIHNFIGESVTVSSEDKVWKTFVVRMKSISLPKSFGEVILLIQSMLSKVSQWQKFVKEITWDEQYQFVKHFGIM